MTDKIDVAFTVLGIEHVTGAGKLVALACVEIDVCGVAIVLQGCQVRRSSSGALSVVAPMFRSNDGVWRSAAILPDSLRDALGAEILANMESKL